MMQGAWPYTVVEVMSCVLVFILCGCGPGPSREPGAPPSPLVVPDCIATALRSPDVQVRLRALDAWVQEGRAGSVDALMLALNDPDERVRTWALQLIEQDWLAELAAFGRDKAVSAQHKQC
jgi:HEAT repeat protein